MKKAVLKWLLIWACWTFAAFFFTSEVVFRGGSVYSIGSWELLLRELINDYIWLALTPVVVRLSRRVPIENPRWWQKLLFHIGAGIVIALFHVAVYTLVIHVSGLALTPSTYFQRFQNLLTFNFHSNIVCYWVIFGIAYAIDSYRRQREKDLRASQLETRLAQSQLQSLKMQFHPHFLFNTLNTISVLMEKDVKAANRMLVQLSDLLRMALDDFGMQEVPLKQEVDFLERYLKIEETRFEERLTVKMNIERQTLGARVPNLILQPLVENAIRHGIAPQITGGTIEIGAKREDQTLCLFVRDTGAGSSGEKDAAKIKEGVGLSNTRARLKQMYNDDHTFQIKNEIESGFLVSIRIPFRTNDASVTL